MAKRTNDPSRGKTRLLLALYGLWRDSVARDSVNGTDAAGKDVPHSDAVLAFCRWVVDREAVEPLSVLTTQLGDS